MRMQYIFQWCTQFSHSTLEHTIQRAHCVIIVEETMDSEALFGAKTKACI